MAQVRLMSDDDGEVSKVLDALMPLLRAHPAFVVSGTRALGKRGPGERVTFELLLTDGADGPEVTVERADSPPPARRALPR
jgi:hypothetical protein